MNNLLMIKYGELTTKKGNRNFFVKTLYNNIKSVLDNEYKITYDRCRMYIEVPSNHCNQVIDKLKKVFGIHGIVECFRVNNNLDDIKSKCLDVMKNLNFKTFKVTCKRADKNFPIHSLEMNDKLGGYILRNINCKVDVHNPDIILNVEVRCDATYIYTGEIKGSGGYPVGIQGIGALMLSGGIDSPVAGYLALKRGISLVGIYFESIPHTSIAARNKVIKLASILSEYGNDINVMVVPFTKIQETIYKNVPDNYVITIMRRMMYRIAEICSNMVGSKIIINGESIGQVASQTLSSMSVINNVTNMPVIRPVCCMDKLEIIDIAKKIGTYDTSILPFEDCCTVFVPRHPIINPTLDKCELYESKFEFDNLIDDAVKNIMIIKSNDKDKYSDYL